MRDSSVSREDFQLAIKKMKVSGVKIHTTASVDRPSGSRFCFFDTEGNLLHVYVPPK
jgi:hypothetical protein